MLEGPCPQQAPSATQVFFLIELLPAVPILGKAAHSLVTDTLTVPYCVLKLGVYNIKLPLAAGFAQA